MNYIVSSYYRGAMNVDQLRSFTDLREAFKYWDSLGESLTGKRMYEVCDHAPPRLLKEKDRPL